MKTSTNYQVYLTIVISYYNLRFLEQTLNSLASQTDKDFKVFIGNDCSPENPQNIIEKFSDKISIKYVEFDKNLGSLDLTKQWERCLKYVESPYFIILGDDDLLSNNTIYEFNKFQKNNTEIFNVYRLGIRRIDEVGNFISKEIVYKDYESSTDFIVKRAKNEVISSLGEYIFATEKYKQVGVASYPKAFYSDNMMVLQISDFGVIKNIKNAFSIIRVSQYSFSGNFSNDIYIHRAASLFFFDLIKKYKLHFKSNNLKYFLPYIIYGKKHAIINISWFDILLMVIKYNGYIIIFDLLFMKFKHFGK